MLHHHCSKPDCDLGARPNKHLAFASLFGVIDTLENISQDIHACAPFWRHGKMAERAKLFSYLFLFTYLAVPSLSCTCGIQFPGQGSNPGPLHWERGVLATGSPGKSWPYFYTALSMAEGGGWESTPHPTVGWIRTCVRVRSVVSDSL